MTKAPEYKFSKQALGAVMMALQQSLLEQSDIVPVFENFRLKNSTEGLVVLNPPLVKFNAETVEQFQVDDEDVDASAAD